MLVVVFRVYDVRRSLVRTVSAACSVDGRGAGGVIRAGYSSGSLGGAGCGVGAGR